MLTSFVHYFMFMRSNSFTVYDKKCVKCLKTEEITSKLNFSRETKSSPCSNSTSWIGDFFSIGCVCAKVYYVVTAPLFCVCQTTTFFARVDFVTASQHVAVEKNANFSVHSPLFHLRIGAPEHARARVSLKNHDHHRRGRVVVVVIIALRTYTTSTKPVTNTLVDRVTSQYTSNSSSSSRSGSGSSTQHRHYRMKRWHPDNSVCM